VNLQDQLRAYYKEQSLPADRVQNILSLGKDIAAKPEPQSTRKKFVRILQGTGLAAMLVVGLMIGSSFNLNTPATAEVTDFILEDVAQGHRMNLEPEIWNNSLDAIQLKMDRLDSACNTVSRIQLPEGFTVVGARYCQLQSVLAMQVRMINKETNERITLYVAPKSSRLESIRVTERDFDGVHVRIWHDGDTVFAVAKSCSGL
jgi:hypothetical protein